MRVQALGLALSLSAISGCGQHHGTDTKAAPDGLSLAASQSLLFATVDRLASPWRAKVVELDLASFETNKILAGESGDPAFYRTGSDVLLFNRSQDSRNFRRLSKSGQSAFQVDGQKAFGGGEFGDPHDALDLGNDRILLAHYTQGSLVIIDKNSGEQVSRIEADWDLPADAAFKPEALVAFERDGKKKIYVVHQALSLAGGLISANGSQQVFVLEQEGSSVRPVDLNPSAAKIQGIKIAGSFPLPVRFQKRDRLLLVSMCSRYTAMGSSLTGIPCNSAVEEIDPATDAVSVLWDLTGSPYSMNGPVIPGPSPTKFFANVDVQTGPNAFEQSVGLFDVADRSFVRMYDFAKDSGGFWAAFFDEASQKLFVGDTNDASGGQFTIMAVGREGERKVVPLDGAPYAGMFILR